MGQPEFEITIGKDGKVNVRVSGAEGAHCMKLADLIRDIVGKEQSRELTSEYYGPGHVRIDARQSQRTTG